jgi:hypothetical protein
MSLEGSLYEYFRSEVSILPQVAEIKIPMPMDVAGGCWL